MISEGSQLSPAAFQHLKTMDAVDALNVEREIVGPVFEA
jgi:hypothetical protein